MKLVRVNILIVVSIFCIGISCSVSKAGENDIKKETDRYKKIFIKIKDYYSISNELQSYKNYINNSISVLNDELWNDKQLYKKIEEHGIFENNNVDLTNSKDKAVEKYDRYLKDNGIKIGYSEGAIFLYFDPIYIYLNFKNVLPEEIIEYFKIVAGDISEGFSQDEALMVPWDSIRKKIVRYENYFKKIGNINCPYIINLTKQKIDLYLKAYMIGLANSPIYDHIDEAKSSYDKFLAENKNSIFHKIIHDYYSDLKRNNFKFGKKEYIKGGYNYVGMTIFDKNNEALFINDLAEQYLKKAKSLMR